MALNSLMAIQKKLTIETAKKTTQFLNYSATHPDTITEYIKIGMILQIYSDASYISEPDAQRKDVRYFFPQTKIKLTNSRYSPRECTSACRIQNDEKCNSIIHRSITGIFF